ncbi:hypothetical protein DAPPUDRAFT_248333 [Daphnia pulex]|uniref:Uncharacterized protein n=1 Tax=Daphnia pulex TaxID=6669 RepID=E9GU69_DAPPU|nr:hypothetical protein DAPPUDRAFT_248333 [Daphnia pulex]|eukprot:EFX76982.1 hypothetical protein DAPPUDRAFT_248333 [Daphnia pulex]
MKTRQWQDTLRKRETLILIIISLVCGGGLDWCYPELLRLVKERYNPEIEVLTIVSDRCPLRKQNVNCAMYLLNVPSASLGFIVYARVVAVRCGTLLQASSLCW